MKGLLLAALCAATLALRADDKPLVEYRLQPGDSLGLYLVTADGKLTNASSDSPAAPSGVVAAGKTLSALRKETGLSLSWSLKPGCLVIVNTGDMFEKPKSGTIAFDYLVKVSGVRTKYPVARVTTISPHGRMQRYEIRPKKVQVYLGDVFAVEIIDGKTLAPKTNGPGI